MDPDFTIVMRGYDRQEVDAHIRDLVAETARLGQRVTELQDRPQESPRGDRGGSGDFQALGEETTRILVAAETAAREMREKAERDADAALTAAERSARQQVDQATAHANRIVREAEGREQEIEAEIARLDEVRATLVDNLRAAIGTTEQAIGAAPRATDVQSPPHEPADGPSATDDAGDDAPAAPQDPVDQEPAHESDEPTATGERIVIVTEDMEDVEDLEDLDPEVEPSPRPQTQPEPEPQPAPQPEPEPEPQPEPDPEPGPEQPAEAPGGADRGALAAALAEADAAVGRPATGAAADEADQEPADAGLLRERSLAGVRPGMLRRLRRGLQDVQNVVLEAVRTRDAGGDVEDLLPDAPAAAGLAEVARVFLDAGYRAGRADAPVLAGDATLQDPPTDTALVADTAELLAAGVLHELRTTLAPSLRAGVDAEEPDASLSERVGEVFRDLKGPIIETVTDQHLTATYGRATLDGWGERDVAHVRWVLGEETRCPESMCRANQDQGAIERGEEFPSGHAVPLAHEGCTCALEPA